MHIETICLLLISRFALEMSFIHFFTVGLLALSARDGWKKRLVNEKWAVICRKSNELFKKILKEHTLYPFSFSKFSSKCFTFFFKAKNEIYIKVVSCPIEKKNISLLEKILLKPKFNFLEQWYQS